MSKGKQKWQVSYNHAIPEKGHFETIEADSVQSPGEENSHQFVFMTGNEPVAYVPGHVVRSIVKLIP